jgi:glycosyltransferase involved in cell wall biosynthesis
MTANSMRVSVVIPVFNAEAYVAEAVQSARSQPETAEVILVEDGSQDSSLSVCQRLAAAHEDVRLLRHPHGRNRGAAASRNLGIENARSECMAFLDADDFYLPGRFSVAKAVLAGDGNVEGVYEAIGCRFETHDAERAWDRLRQPRVTTIKAGIPPERLFIEQSPIGGAGHCSLNGLTVKRAVFEKVGLFDNSLILVEDTAFFIKLAACARLLPGRVDIPVAMRRVHASNRITQHRDEGRLWSDRLSIWLSVLRWMRQQRLRRNKEQERVILSKMIWDMYRIAPTSTSRLMCLPTALRRCFIIFWREPSLFGDRAFSESVLRRLAGLLK